MLRAAGCVHSGSHVVEDVVAIENGGQGISGANTLQELADARANGSDPVSAVIPRGAVLIRDVRLCEFCHCFTG
eukprot:COSAG02_NODE_12546_length_1527_cov_1.727591_1_plen_74_part_00